MDKELDTLLRHDAIQEMDVKKVYRLSRRSYPYVPPLYGYGPGCAVPWPHFSMFSVGYVSDEKHPGNLIIPNPGKYGCPDGGKWEIVRVWQTGWMSIRSLITNEVIFSVPPGTLEEIDGQSD